MAAQPAAVPDERWTGSAARRRRSFKAARAVLAGDPALRHLTPDDLDDLTRRLLRDLAAAGLPV